MSAGQQPLISIITVVLNGAQTLEKSMQSILQQKFSDYEYIVIDGGSSDGTLEILKKNDRHITYWLSEPDKGVYDAMNKAIKFAQGEWIYFLGSDDYLACDLGEIAEYLKDKQTIYYGDVYRPIINRRYDGPFSPYKLASRNICQQSIFYPESVWKKYSFNLKYPVLADYELNMRCFADPDIKMQYIPVTIAVFHDRGGLSPTQDDLIFEADRMKLIRENFTSGIFVMAAIRFRIIQLLGRLGLGPWFLKAYNYCLRIVRPSNIPPG